MYGYLTVGVSTCNWMLIVIHKGAYCNFSLWGFYDTVWQCFLRKLVAARHVLYSLGLSVLNFLCYNDHLKRNISTILRLLLDCDFFFDWFHSDLYILDCVTDWFPDSFRINCIYQLTSIALTLCSSKVSSLHRPIFITLHNFISDTTKLVVFGTWRLESPYN